MSRKEFMEELENMLENIQKNEREEALQYYNDYFDEAGPENEEQVINELGTPAKVAAIIKTSLQENENESGEFTERGYSDPRFTINYEVIDSTNKGNQDTNSSQNQRTAGRERKYAKETSGGKIALIVILCALAIPVGVPLLGGLIGLFAGVLGLGIGIFVAIVVLALALSIGGVVCFIVGIVTLFSTPTVGVFSCGVGMIMVGIGILFVLLTAVICYKFIPWLIRCIVDLFRAPLKRKETIV
ncbi:putative membrane protein [Lachnotalea glycerini]|uniref:DUF1700 domain-containing protein n=1 Tax=Lachnotalea glycerini TaxID=1763509 RepID=A0A255IKY5_9FIRM|nr:DUF1700 domain-containing protein [Lachnotalea glycerini]PXV88345.1 putative membrane protein [Lachnotalea glycerini]RDY27653.1 DUF1700 domain-containing protein [Lachnotalea glycerini]